MDEDHSYGGFVIHKSIPTVDSDMIENINRMCKNRTCLKAATLPFFPNIIYFVLSSCSLLFNLKS